MSSYHMEEERYCYMQPSAVFEYAVSLEELRELKRSVENQVEEVIPNLPVEMSIDDPATICAHVHKAGIPSKPVFGNDIKVNQIYFHTVWLPEYEVEHSRKFADRRKRRSRSRSRKSRRSRTPERRRDRYDSRERTRRKTRSPSFSPEEHRPDCPMYKPRYRRGTSRRRHSRQRSVSRHKSKIRARRYSNDRRSSRYHRSRSRSVSTDRSKPGCSHYKSPDRKRFRRSSGSRYRSHERYS